MKMLNKNKMIYHALYGTQSTRKIIKASQRKFIRYFLDVP